MQIQLNGENKSLPDNSTINDIIELLGIAESRYAVEVNLDIIPRSEHAEFTLSEGDKVEVVQAIGGG